MDSVERLSDSIDQVLVKLAALRRENQELREELVRQSELHRASQIEMQKALDESKEEKQDPSVDVDMEARCSQAELEASQLAEEFEEQKRLWIEREEELESQLKILEEQRETASQGSGEVRARLADAEGALEKARKELAVLEEENEAFHAQQDDSGRGLVELRARLEKAEEMLDQAVTERDESRLRLKQLEQRYGAAEQEAGSSGQRLKETEAALALVRTERDEIKVKLEDLEELLDEATQADQEEEAPSSSPEPDLETAQALEDAQEKIGTLSRAKAELELKLAEAAAPVEVDHWQAKIRALEEESEHLKRKEANWETLVGEQQKLKKEKRVLSSIKREREDMRRRLQEIFNMLENLRL